MNYKSSKYNHFFKTGDSFFVYNFISTSICEIEENIYFSLANNSLADIDKNIIMGLIDEGFIVEDGLDELSTYNYYYNSTRFGNASSKLRITILPTYGCNLACPYCYQGQDKIVDKINTDQIDAIVKFTENQINDENTNKPVKDIYVSFFGGEPLLYKEEITYACEQLYSIKEKYNLNIFFDITTNLTLLTDEFVDVIKKYNIDLQVTIDGTPEEHDKRRIYKNGKGTYSEIISNLKTLNAAGIKDSINIRINVDETTIDYASEMYDNASKYAGNAYFGYLKEYKSYNDDYNNICIDRECFSTAATKKLYDVFSKRGISPSYDFGKRSPCYLNSMNAYIFDPYLDVYKCEMLQGHKECKVGELDMDGNFQPNKNFYQQMSFEPSYFSKCRECKLIPLCGAGCSAEKYVNSLKKDGNILFSDCIFNEKILDEYLVDYVTRYQENI